jgi:hypothetical protein
MTTQAALDLHDPRPGARPVQDSPSTGLHIPPTCAGDGPVYAGIAVGAMAVAGATAVGLRWASRPAAPRTISMGPGGWISFKGLTPPPISPRRPWWAVLLRAQRCT